VGGGGGTQRDPLCPIYWSGSVVKIGPDITW